MQSLIFVYLLIFALQISARHQCKFPGHYRNGIVLPMKTLYDPGEQVIHTCTTGYYMLHNPQFVRQLQSTCESRGIWNESVPVCDYIDVFRNKAVLSGTSGNNTSSMVDEDESTCGKVEFPNDSTSTVVTLSDVPDSDDIHIIVSLKTLDRVPEGTKMHVFLQLSGWSAGNTAFDCDSDAAKPIIIRQSMNISISCKLTGGTSASRHSTDAELHFEMSDAKDVPILSICSLKGLVLSKRSAKSDNVKYDVVELGLTLPCWDSPELLATEKVNAYSKLVQYTCNAEYTLCGAAERKCAWNNDQLVYYWSGTAPVCVSPGEDLPDVTKGSLTSLRPKVAILQCFPRITSRTTNQFTYCNQSMNGTWQQNVSDPQEFPHKTERKQYANRTHTRTAFSINNSQDSQLDHSLKAFDYWPYICLATGTWAFFITLLYTVTFCYCFRRTRKQSETALYSWIKGNHRLKRDHDTRILKEKQCDPIIVNETLHDLNENRDYHLYEIPR